MATAAKMTAGKTMMTEMTITAAEKTTTGMRTTAGMRTETTAIAAKTTTKPASDKIAMIPAHTT